MSDRWRVEHGDCLDRLRELPDGYADSLVTDPPAGIGFMGKAWDGDKGGCAQWIAFMAERFVECLRVLKPGAQGLVWALPRTSDLTMMALRTAGFEIRDVVTHLFGTGMPKGANISKAIDAHYFDEWLDDHGFRDEYRREMADAKARNAADEVEAIDLAWHKAAGVVREVVGKNPNFRDPDTDHHERWNNAVLSPDVTSPATDAAKRWDGWHTELAPASEHWILVRKPLEGTVAGNVLKHGTGGLNIDACRIATAEPVVTFDRHAGTRARDQYRTGTVGKRRESEVGRFTTNVVLSDDAPAMLDAQTGILTSGKPGVKRKAGQDGTSIGRESRPVGTQMKGPGDSGGASRFFYCAKPSPAEKTAGLYYGNSHPTVKSIDLGREFCTMVTPPDGLVLDPFTGSGSLGISALLAGFRYHGIEQDAESVAAARSRIAYWAQHGDASAKIWNEQNPPKSLGEGRKRRREKADVESGQGSLF